MQHVNVTSTIFPISSLGPGTCTMELFESRPVRREESCLFSSSMSTGSVLPVKSPARSAETRCTRESSRSKRSLAVSPSTWPSIEAAGVPARFEYRKVNALSNRTLSTTSSVSSKSSSVSPGNPTMMSVVIETSGTASLIRSASLT